MQQFRWHTGIRRPAAHRSKAAPAVTQGRTLEGVQGVFGYDWQGRIANFGATGHVDIGKLPTADVTGITEYGTGAYFMDGPMKVYFWGSA